MKTRQKIIDVLADSLEIPESAYEAAVNRYADLGKWLTDESKARSAQFSPIVVPQGSFSLGTATKPWKREDYDLDLVCTLNSGISKSSHSQDYLKKLVGTDLDTYREERNILEKLEEKHRCWRLNYQDQLKFHMDITPSIPQSEHIRQILMSRMTNAGNDEAVSRDLSGLAIAITDDTLPNYKIISEDWNISNPEGYTKWFVARMRQAHQFLTSRAMAEKVANVDDLPRYKWKTPLQRCIQILKRHRDIMFEKNPDGKPISVIITTLAAKAYQGESDIYSAMDGILNGMANFINAQKPRIPNPVNPAEDFADKWSNEQELDLEQNFLVWLEQARIDFENFTSSGSKDIADQALRKYGSSLENETIEKITATSPGYAHTTKINHISENVARPWGFLK